MKSGAKCGNLADILKRGEMVICARKASGIFARACARALLNAVEIMQNSPIPQMVKERYSSFDSGIGKDFEDGKLTLEQVYEYGKKVEEPKQTSGKQELYETIVALYAK